MVFCRRTRFCFAGVVVVAALLQSCLCEEGLPEDSRNSESSGDQQQDENRETPDTSNNRQSFDSETPDIGGGKQGDQQSGENVAVEGMKDLPVDSSSQLDGAGKLPEVKTKADDANDIGNADQILQRMEEHVNNDKQSKKIEQKLADDVSLLHQKSGDQVESKIADQAKKASMKKLKAKVAGSKKKPKRKQGDQEVIHNWDTSPEDFGGEDDDMAPPYDEVDSMDDDNADEDSLNSDKSDYSNPSNYDADPLLDDVDSHSDDTVQHSDSDYVDPHSDDVGSASDDDVMGHDDAEHEGEGADEDDDRVSRMHEHLKSEIKQLQGDEKMH